MMKSEFAAIATFSILGTLSSCGQIPIVDCVELDATSPQTGICETTGIVEISQSGAVTLLIMRDGRRAGITLHNHPEIEDGDAVYVKADYYFREGRIDLVDYIEMNQTDTE